MQSIAFGMLSSGLILTFMITIGLTIFCVLFFMISMYLCIFIDWLIPKNTKLTYFIESIILLLLFPFSVAVSLIYLIKTIYGAI